MQKHPNRINKIKRVLAWAGIIVLVALYLITFLLGIFGNAHTQALLRACIVLTIIVPVLIYAMMMVARALSRDAQEPQEKTDDQPPHRS